MAKNSNQNPQESVATPQDGEFVTENLTREEKIREEIAYAFKDYDEPYFWVVDKGTHIETYLPKLKNLADISSQNEKYPIYKIERH